MGLLGTVIGMIETFQSITLFGAGDPKTMASGISTALMTTVLGLCVAIPTTLLHAIVNQRSRSIIHILDEQSAGIVAAARRGLWRFGNRDGITRGVLRRVHRGCRRSSRKAGNVLYLIALTTFLMWTLIFERVWYFRSEHRRMVHDVTEQWESRAGAAFLVGPRDSATHWCRRPCERIDGSFPIILTCVALCPLLGLLGTVTGMIAVFDAMATQGRQRPVHGGGGVSQATIPTMCGMIASLSGIFGTTFLRRKIHYETEHVQDRLTMGPLGGSMEHGRFSARDEDSDINLTPMLDVVFIMLIFFIVTRDVHQATRRRGPTTRCRNRRPKAHRQCAGLAIDAAGNIWIDKKKVDEAGVQAHIERSTHGESQGRRLVIQADRDSTYGRLKAVPGRGPGSRPPRGCDFNRKGLVRCTLRRRR